MTGQEPKTSQEPTGESLGAELWRLWTGEIKPHFTSEAEFLKKYGEEAGYDRAYIGRVLSDHRLMEELVWGKDDESAARFAKVLAAHIEFKNAFFKERVRDIVGSEEVPSEAPAPGQPT